MTDTPQGQNAVDTVTQRVGAIVAAIVGIALLWRSLHSISPYLTYWLIWCIVFYALVLFLNSLARPVFLLRNRRWIIRLLIVAGVLLLGFQIHNYLVSKKRLKFAENFEKKLRSLRWITYEPTTMDPYRNYYGTKEDIREELTLLRDGGFTGVITFSSNGNLALIPEQARNLGFKGVIMGVINTTDMAEVRRAIGANKHVDAYCIGHQFTDYPHSQTDVLRAVRMVRNETDLPVTTTLRPNGYRAFPEIAQAVDWFFPDIHGNWYRDASAEVILGQTKRFIKEITQLQSDFPDKPVLLKMISLPSKEVCHASPEEQYKFFRLVVEYVESSMEFPDRVYPSYFSGFDVPWKKPERKWPLGERYVGFFGSDRKPKNFKNEANGRVLRTIEALDWSRVKTTPQD